MLFFVEDLLLLWVVVFVTLMVTSPMLDERPRDLGRNKPSSTQVGSSSWDTSGPFCGWLGLSENV